MARPSRTALSANDSTFLWKVILRLLAILCAIVGIATIGWALSNQSTSPNDESDENAYYSYSDYYFEDFATLPWTFITLGLSIIWNIANLAFLVFRNRPIHPGANVGCDLVLWLGLIVTGTAAVIGSLNYFYYFPAQYDNGSNPYDSYGTFSNSSGTWNQLPNESLVNSTIANQCGGFDTCAQLDQYAKGLQHKGIVIAVGCAMSFIVLLFHLALFISACRYTHARRYGAGSKYAKAITSEATEIANKMVAEMTGPNGTFRPRSQQQQQQQQPEWQPMMRSDPEMQQSSQPSAPSTNPVYPTQESSVSPLASPNSVDDRGPPQIMPESPSAEATHPGFRRG